MDRKIAALLGAAAALTTVTAAQATVPAQSGAMAPPASYQDLLDSVPNPVAALKADDARLLTAARDGSVAPSEDMQVAQYYHHHHHHHHHVVPRPLRRIFHPRRHHHHHHHHHHHY